MLFNHNINNLNGGVSQQVNESRYDNQVDEMINFFPTVSQGLRRRNALTKVADLGTTFQTNMAIHSYDRGDDIEKYGMIFDNNGLKVFDTAGVQKTVTDFGSVGNTVLEQWAGTDWEKDLRFLTVGDTTWILNTSMTAETTGALTPTDASDFTGFFWIKKSFNDGTSGLNHGYSYSITLTDLSTITYNHTDSIEVAKQLAIQINAGAGSYTARHEGSILYVTRATTFDMATGDSWGNQASIAWGNGVSKIGDLPASMDGFTNAEVGTVAITGTDRDTFTNYYLTWEDDHWKEWVKEGVEYKLDEMTMPAKLVRQSDGSFVLGWNVENLTYEGFRTIWGERDKGDDDSNPLPSFVDNQISNMFFFKNRLGFTSGENVILSRTASYYDFFASTVIEILDTDPIDTSADSENISIIRAVNVTAGSVTLWTDTAQFILAGGDVLSPATTRVTPTSTYVVSPEVAPVNVDNEVMFFTKKGDWLDVSTYAPAILDSDKSTASKLNAHCPEYIPSTVTQVETALSENMVFFFGDAENDTIYVYKYHIDNNKRVMSAWFEWNFNIAIKKINVLDNVLFVLGGTDDLYTIDLSVGELTDVYTDDGAFQYTSSVTLSRFGIENRQNTQGFREKFFMKTVLSRVEGDTDLTIVNSERNNEKTIATKHISLGRKILIGADSDRVRLKYETSYATGVAINIVNVEGQTKVRSRNA